MADESELRIFRVLSRKVHQTHGHNVRSVRVWRDEVNERRVVDADG